MVEVGSGVIEAGRVRGTSDEGEWVGAVEVARAGEAVEGSGGPPRSCGAAITETADPMTSCGAKPCVGGKLKPEEFAAGLGTSVEGVEEGGRSCGSILDIS